MFGRKHRDLVRRIEELEQRLDVRRWDLPPENTIDTVDLPELPDYSTHEWDGDADVEGWARPYGYL